MYMITQIIKNHYDKNWIFSITTNDRLSYRMHLTGYYENQITANVSLNLIKEIEYKE